MRDAQVLEFPKAQSARKRMQDKSQEQKTVLVLSIASVLLMTVFLNQWLVDGPDQTIMEQGNRGIASFDPGAAAESIKWEHDLAKKISSDKSLFSASLAEQPTVRDELIFGFLEGKYGMKLSQGRIQSIEFIDAQAGERPLEIENRADFLKKYAEAFGLQYSDVNLAKSEQGLQIYKLISSAKEIIGEAHFVIDDEGRVQSINFK